jgi:protein TonB
MKTKDKILKNLSALTSMLFGTALVLATLVLINDSQLELDNINGSKGSEIKFERKKQQSQQQVQKPKPKLNPKKTRSVAPAPLIGLSSQLGGLDLGLPDFSMDGLNALEGGILSNSNNLIMTDEMVDQTPKAVYQAPISYPARARAKGQEGYVVFSLLIGITGEIEQLKIVESYPEGLFDDVATQSVNAWKFEPALYQGKSVKSWAKQKVRFDLS